MKNYPHIIAKVYREPWCILPEKHEAICRALEAHLGDFDARSNALEMIAHDDEPRITNGQAVIPVFGIIGQHLSGMEIACGGCSLDELSDALEVAEDDDSVDEILLNFRSPGGTVTGVPEIAERIAGINKRVVAFSDSQMCSAAYWLAAGADDIYCTKSSIIGSIGCYAIYLDMSRKMEMEGVKANAIFKGDLKLAGAPFKPMTDEERGYLQARADKFYKDFTSHISSHRPEVQPDSMRGQIFDGQDAAGVGLVDGLVDSLSELLR